ncbi:hypothetical protein KY319_01755 [Candidatus Woesearchaeota archaeon]|nr:hypothetical protein [Candidatus Woesearchaeota archaeon]
MHPLKSFFFIFLTCLLAISSTAITLSYGPTEYLYTPDKQIDYTFFITNSRDNSAEITLDIDAGELKNYVTLPPMKLELKPKEQKKLNLKIYLPKNLPNGLYPIFIKASEGKGSTKSASEVTVNILKPNDIGYPRANLKILEFKEKLRYLLTIRNIGKTQYQTNSKLLIKDNEKIILEIPVPQTLIPEFQTKHILDEIQIPKLPNGEYTAEINIEEQKLTQKIRYGKIEVTTDKKFSLVANEKNEFTIPLTMNWNKPIETDAKLYIFKQKGGKLLQKELKLNLNPGLNTVLIDLIISQTSKGEYKAVISSGGDNEFKTEFTVDMDSTITKEEELTGAITVLSQRKEIVKICVLVSIAFALILIVIALSIKNEKKERV